MLGKGHFTPVFEKCCSAEELDLIKKAHLEEDVATGTLLTLDTGTRNITFSVPRYFVKDWTTPTSIQIIKDGISRKDYDEFLVLLSEYTQVDDNLIEFSELYKDMVRVCKNHIHVKQIVGFAIPDGLPDDSTVKTKRSHAKIKSPSKELLAVLSGLKLTGVF